MARPEYSPEWLETVGQLLAHAEVRRPELVADPAARWEFVVVALVLGSDPGASSAEVERVVREADPTLVQVAVTVLRRHDPGWVLDAS